MRGLSRIMRLTEWIIGIISPRRAAYRAHFRRMATDVGYRETALFMMRAIIRVRSKRAARVQTQEPPIREN